MSNLTIKLFGPPQIALDGVQLDLQHHKPVALLAYLAVTQQMHTRDALATLLWPEYGQARAYLRNNLAIIRRALGPMHHDWLYTDRTTVGLQPDANCWVDVTEFQAKLAGYHAHSHGEHEDRSGASCEACQRLLNEALTLYQADFLAGFTLRDSPAFDEWQFFQREQLRRDLVIALEKPLQQYLAHNELEAAIKVAHRWLEIDPVHEPVHRHLMQLYAWSGQERAALRQYQECKRLLALEVNLLPDHKTHLLYEAIQEKKLTPPPGVSRIMSDIAIRGGNSTFSNVPFSPADPESERPNLRWFKLD